MQVNFIKVNNIWKKIQLQSQNIPNIVYILPIFFDCYSYIKMKYKENIK